ncbi:MAG: RNA-dependent DNA polymerase, partial [Bacteroidota bacterium]
MRNEGLSLQKHKTQLYTITEFQKLVSSKILAESDDAREKSRATFLSLPINYDPYSDSADDDYEKIKRDLETFDIIGILNEELSKARIHQQFGKQIIKTFDILEPSIISNAFNSIIEKFELLYPIIPAIMTSAYKNFSRLEKPTQEKIQEKLGQLIRNKSYIVQSELYMSYVLRVIGLTNSPENEEILNIAYTSYSDSNLVKSLVFQIMTRWKAYYWLSDK